MTTRYEKSLQDMQGKSFIYMGNEISILEVSFKDGHATVKTDKREYGLFDNDKAREFVNNCLPVKAVSNNGNLPAEISGEVNQFTATIDKMINVMERTIDKMEKDSNYVKQATQINKSATQIINAAKLKLETARFVDKRRNKNED